jgi:hypothetical protein
LNYRSDLWHFWHSGLIAKLAIEMLAGTPVEVECTSEFRYRSPILFRGVVLVAISQSGIGIVSGVGPCSARWLMPASTFTSSQRSAKLRRRPLRVSDLIKDWLTPLPMPKLQGTRAALVQSGILPLAFHDQGSGVFNDVCGTNPNHESRVFVAVQRETCNMRSLRRVQVGASVTVPDSRVHGHGLDHSFSGH